MKPFVGYGYCPRVRSDGSTYLSELRDRGAGQTGEGNI